MEILGFLGAAREALESMLAGAGLDSSMAEILSTVVFVVLMMVLYLGVAIGYVLLLSRRARLAEVTDRAAGAESRRQVGVDAPWEALMPVGWEADEVAWVYLGQERSRVLLASVLRLVRTGVLRLGAADPEAGGMSFARRHGVEPGDVLGACALERIFIHGGRRVTLLEAMDADEWEVEREGRSIAGYRQAVTRVPEEAGLTIDSDGRVRLNVNAVSVAYVVLGLLVAILFSSAIPEVFALAIFMAGSMVVALAGGYVRERTLTPAGAAIADRLDVLRARLVRAAAMGEHIGSARATAAQLMEFAVVVGLSASELAQLAKNAGDAELRALFAEPVRCADPRTVHGDAREALRELGRYARKEGMLNRALAIQTMAQHQDTWLRIELAPND